MSTLKRWGTKVVDWFLSFVLCTITLILGCIAAIMIIGLMWVILNTQCTPDLDKCIYEQRIDFYLEE